MVYGYFKVKKWNKIGLMHWLGVLVMSFPLGMLAQDSLFTMDSILDRTSQQDDSSRVVTFNHMVFQLSRTNKPLSLQCSDSAIFLSEKLTNPILLAESYLNRGVWHYRNGENTMAIPYYDSALMFIDPQDSVRLADVYNNYGLSYRVLGDFDQSIKYLYLALNYCGNDQMAAVNKMANLAGLFYYTGDLDKSVDLFRQTLPIFKSLDRKYDLATTLRNIAQVYETIGNLDSSEVYAIQAYESSQVNNLPRVTATSAFILGSIKLNQGALLEAETYLMEAFSFAEHSDALEIKAEVSKLLMKLYQALNNVEKASLYGRIALDIALKNQLTVTQIDLYQQLSDLAEDQGLFQEALAYHKLYKQLADSVLSIDTRKQLAEIETKYETEQKELIIKKHELELRNNQRTIQFIVILLVVLVFTTIILVRLYLRKQAAFRKLVDKNYDLAQKSMKERSRKGETTLSPKQKSLYKLLLKALEEDQLYTDQQLTIDKLSKTIQSNRTDLSELIRVKTGKNYPVLINELRVKHAVRMLSHTNQMYSIEAIAHDSGFNSTSNFYRIFKESTGLTPNAFQKMKASS